MAITTDSVLSDTVPTVLAAAQMTREFVAVMTNHVWKIQKKLHDGKNVNVPTFGSVTAKVLTEGVDNTTSETMADTLVTVTPAEVGCKIILTDKVVRDNNEDVKMAAGRMLGAAYALKEDQDLLALLASGANSLGAGGTLTLGQIAASRAIIRGVPRTSGGPWTGSLTFVQHPYVTLDIVDVFTPLVPAAGTTQSAAGNLADSIVTGGVVGRLFGMPVVEDGNIDTATIANTAKGGVFASGANGAIIQAVAKEWEVEPERDASLRATELNITGEYGVGIYLDDWIVTANNDATTPA